MIHCIAEQRDDKEYFHQREPRMWIPFGRMRRSNFLNVSKSAEGSSQYLFSGAKAGHKHGAVLRE